MIKTALKAFTIWDALGFAAFCAAIWCAWMLMHSLLQIPGPNLEAARFLCSFLAFAYLMLVFFSIRMRAWITMGLCIVGALACAGLLLKVF